MKLHPSLVALSGFALFLLVLLHLAMNDALALAQDQPAAQPLTNGTEWVIEAQGGDFLSVSMLNSNAGWAMADTGRYHRQFYQFSGGNWLKSTVTFSGTVDMERMYDFVMTGDAEGWAVGQAYVYNSSINQWRNQGRIWYVTGGIWSQAPVTPTGILRAIKPANQVAGWAYGQNSLYYYNGENWLWKSDGGGADIQAADGLENHGQYWMAIQNPIVHYLVDSQRPGQPYQLQHDINDIDVISPTAGWAVGESGYVLQFDGTSWFSTTTPAGPTDTLIRVQGIDAHSVFVLGYSAGNDPFAMHFNGVAWIKTMLQVPNVLTDLAMVTASDGWILGKNGGVMQWDGTVWNDRSEGVEPPAAGAGVSDIKMVSATFGAVAASSNVLLFDGMRWNPAHLPRRDVNVTSVDVLSPTSVVAAGRYRLQFGDWAGIWHFDGAVWQEAPVNLRNDYDWCDVQNVTDVSMIAPNNGWASVFSDCNDGLGELIHYDGATWEYSPLASYEGFWPRIVEMVSSNDGWVVHYDATESSDKLMRFNGTQWNNYDIVLGGCQRIYNIDAVASDNVWAVASSQNGCNGQTPGAVVPLLLHFDGVNWTSQSTPDNVLLKDVHYLSDTEVWVVGDGGAIYVYDGTSWTRQSSSVDLNLTGVFMLDSEVGRILADKGTILNLVIKEPTDIRLSVSKDGSGSGLIVSIPPGIDCGSDCVAVYPHGTVITLTASANMDSTFSGWAGACAGAGACQVTLDAAKSVTATFSTPSQTAISINGQTVVGQTIEFSATLGLSNFDECMWAFGDDASMACQSARMAEQLGTINNVTVRASHSFEQAGRYTVTVTARNVAGQSQASVQVEILGADRNAIYLPLLAR